jgi:outer membrane protein TolC
MTRLTLTITVLLSVATHAGAQNLDELRKQKLELAQESYRNHWQKYKNGQGHFDELYRWSLRWLTAAREAEPKADPVPHLQAHLDRMRELEAIVQTQHKAGVVTKGDLLEATYYRVDAQIQLELAKAKKKE